MLSISRFSFHEYNDIRRPAPLNETKKLQVPQKRPRLNYLKREQFTTTAAKTAQCNPVLDSVPFYKTRFAWVDHQEMARFRPTIDYLRRVKTLTISSGAW